MTVKNVLNKNKHQFIKKQNSDTMKIFKNNKEHVIEINNKRKIT